MKRLVKGFSLVELLIALVIGLVVSMVAAQIFTANLRSSETQRVMTEVQESGRYALQMLASDIRRAGMPRSDASLAEGNAGYITTPIVFGVDASQEGGNTDADNDQIAFRFYGVSDCEGETAAGATFDDPALIVNTYYIQKNADGINELFCRGDVNAATTGAAMISGVDSFQVQYGLDRPMTAGESRLDRVAFAGRYVNADQVTAAESVVSVRVALLISAEVDNLPDLKNDQVFQVLDKTLTNGEGVLQEAKMRRLFMSTVKLRNLPQQGVLPNDILI
ncbi:hypothetical protein Y5S_03119 [Alcanivorax nanhaiticus]|uniref:Prepilin-type N-terminal cleavage/methylation domain-containing protein n=1 Tax=Alcanivorax nanhaiticus TaxID=1177154 RepID=A0A095SGG8_9GAMM|nr:PilW family protein [Alcanivorax nanhaiticus]KGD63696.1 hypothetical protein Y5S_03119 [Alcanivorax nanhaiticus]